MPLPSIAGNKDEMENKRNLAAQKRMAAQFEFAQTNTDELSDPEDDEADEQDDNSDDGEIAEDASLDPADDGAGAATAEAEQAPDNSDDMAVNNNRTTGDIEHEKALAGRLDRQKGIEEQTKLMQDAIKRTENASFDAALDDKTKNAEASAETPEQQNEQENARALQQEKRAAMTAQPQEQKPPVAQPNQQQTGQTPEQGIGMIHNTARLLKKGFSCTGCIGTIIRLVLDYVGAFYVYVFLDGLVKEENTDRIFTGAYCLTMLGQLLVLLSPIIIAVALASAAGYLLNGLVDMDTILNFIK